LNLSYFISKRISNKQQGGFSGTIHKIGVASIAIGLGALIVSFLIMKGFQETVKNKIYNFSGHLIVKKLTPGNSMEDSPIYYNLDLYNHPEKYEHVKHVQEYAHKAGLIKTEEEILGVVLKGVGTSFAKELFQENMVAGKFITFPDSGYSNEVVISKAISDKLKIKLHDDVLIHFFQNPPRVRKLTVSGIYETNLSEYYDDKIIIGDIRMIARLNDWRDSIAGGLEVFVDDLDHIDDVGFAVAESMDYNVDTFDLTIERISDNFYQVFEWLNLLSRQVNFLLIIILVVVCVNMISIVLILVMERTQMIGMLKALGAKDRLIRSVFVYQGINLVLKGLFWGNLIGLGLCYIQYKFKVISLNPKDYYMDVVPVSWHWEIVGLLNVLVFLVITVVLLLPTLVVSRISPIKAIRFD
jgi:lipoprotein-releasing system permease protein